MDRFRHHKERAAAFLSKGKRKHALKEYRAALDLKPSDVQVRQKLADLLLRLGYDDAAIREYQHVAGKYAADGFLVKAMAICKVILGIDPEHTETQSVLAELFAAQHPDAVLPPSMTAALMQPSLRVTPLPRGTRATRSTPAARESPPLSPSPSAPRRARPPLTVVPSMPLPEDSGLRLDEVEAAVGPASPPRVEPPASFDQPAEDDPSSGVWASSSSPSPDEHPHTLVPGIFGLEEQDEVPAATAARVLREDDSESGDYLALDDDDELTSGDIDVEAHTTSVDTSEVSVDRAGLPPIPLFSQLDKGAFIALFERLQVKSAPAGERLITEGQTTRTMYIIAQGEVRVFREQGGAEIELARLEDGGFFGELALLSSSPRMASVETTQNTILLEMTRDDVSEIVRRHPSVTDVLVRFYRERFLANLVRSNPLLFAPLSDEEKRAVFEHCQSVTVAPGTALLQKGEMGQGLYLILRGTCDVSDTSADGREIRLPSLGEGDFFGELSLLLHTAVTATVTARTTCVVLRLPREVFYEKVMKHPEVRRVMTEVTHERLQQAVDARYGVDDPVLI